MAIESEKDPCEVCVNQEALTLFSGFDGVHQNCPRCGEFKLTGTASSIIHQGLGKDKRALLSGWIRNQNRLGSIPMINSENLEKILETPIPSVSERAKALLLEASNGLKNLGDSFNINDSRFLAATYSSNTQDISFLMRMLEEQGLAEAKTLGGGCEILPRGYVYLDEIQHKSASIKGFVAMSFNGELDEIYSSGFQIGIIEAGYEPVRMDKIEHINKIDDEIINQINTSKFIVADFTDHKGGVYFEAGYALGIGLPVFWTCRKKDMHNLHFDIRQFNCIDWESTEDLANRLRERIEAVLGRGPR